MADMAYWYYNVDYLMYLVITPSKQDTFIKNLDAHVSHAIVLSDVQNNIFFLLLHQSSLSTYQLFHILIFFYVCTVKKIKMVDYTHVSFDLLKRWRKNKTLKAGSSILGQGGETAALAE